MAACRSAINRLLTAWRYWQQKRLKLIAELQRRDKPPYVWNIRIPGSDDIIMGDDFAHVLQVMRRRASADHWRLDLKATIAATAARGGMPEFRYQQQTRPLVDYYSRWAQQDPAAAPKYRAISGTGSVEEITSRALAALG